jgi:hypothetical protein
VKEVVSSLTAAPPPKKEEKVLDVEPKVGNIRSMFEQAAKKTGEGDKKK